MFKKQKNKQKNQSVRISKIKIGKQIIKLGVFLSLSVFAFLSYNHFSKASIPDFVNYQGKLMDNSGNPITAATTIQFSLYNVPETAGTPGTPGDVPSAGGPLLWTETYGAGGCSQITPGTDGIFAQHLGDCIPFPAYLDFTQEYYLGVKIGVDAEAAPRVELSTHPYAFTSKRLNVRDENIYITSENSGDIILQAADNIILNDTNGEVGTAGQVLSSIGGTGGIDWIDASSLSAGSLWDGDHDTGIQVEKNPDEDIIRFDTLGGQRAKIDNAGNVLFSNLDPADLLNPGALAGLLFRNDKASMRIGEANNNEWNDANIGNGSFASGRNNVVSGNYSTALGGSNDISDVYSVAMGRNNTITSSYTVAGGYHNTIGSYAGMVFGQTNTVSDTRAAAWGLDNTASEREATAWGRNTEASAPYATSWGRNTVASGEHSTAFGYQNTASDDYGLAFGYNNTASGRYATVWGGQNTASGQYSTAFGSHNTASGAHSTAIGYYSEASAENGVAIGDALANSNYMTALGRFNENVAGQSLTNWVDTDQLFVIGNGTGWQNANRSNALTILKNGSMEINAPVDGAVLTQQPTGGVDLAIATTKYVNDVAANVNPTWQDVFDNELAQTPNYIYAETPSIEFEDDGAQFMIQSKPTKDFTFGAANVLYFNFNGGSQTAQIFDSRAAGSQAGIEYFQDYSADYSNRSLVDKEYVDGQLMWEILPASTGGMRIQPKNNSVRQIFVQRDDNSYTQFKVRNNNDTGNGAGAIIELKGSGADYTNNMYIGKYGASFWIPELQDNGAVLTDKNLVIGTASDTNEIHFVTGHSYTNLAPVVVADDEGFRYTSDLSATFVDRTLVDKAYVDGLVNSSSVTASNGLTKVGNDIQLGGLLTADTYVNKSGHSMRFNGDGFFQTQVYSNGQPYYTNVQQNLDSYNYFIQRNSDGHRSFFEMNPSHMVFVDQINNKGVEYQDDYSINYTNRSLVDKEYVDNRFGVFQRSGNIVSNEGTNYATDNLVFGSPQMDDDGDSNHDHRMFYNKSKGALRVGMATGSQWDDANIGFASFATGNNNNAQGSYATAFGNSNLLSQDYTFSHGRNNRSMDQYAVTFGEGSVASGQYAFATGLNAYATGDHSTAIGPYTLASGDYATAFNNATANSMYMTAFGRFNDYASNQSLDTWIDTDQLLVVGNGTDGSNRSNALTILKNGTITAPTFSLAEINTAGNTALTTKEYVDNAILSGTNNIYTADGTLTGDRVVTSNGNELTFTGSGGNGWIFEANDAPDTSFLNIYPDEMEFNASNGVSNAGLVFNTSSANLYWNNGGALTGLSISSNPTFTDEINSRGLEYGADYSANYTNRTLVDKEYVDNEITASASNIYIADGTLTSNRTIGGGGNPSDSNITFDWFDNFNIGTSNFNLISSGSAFFRLLGGDVIQIESQAGMLEFNANTSNTTYTDNKYGNGTGLPAGILYAADYSSEFGDRSLVDKGYVDNAITAGNIYGTNGTLTGDRIVSTGGNNLTFQGTQYSSINLNSGDEIYLENYWSNQRMTWDSLNTHIEQSGGGTSTDFNIGNNVTTITSNYGSFAGFQYGADYSANYTNRSLVDKAYVDSQVAGNISPWTQTGTNLSPTTAGDDVLLNAGETLSIADMTQGSLMFAGAGGLISQDNANLFWDDANDRLGIGTTTPDYTLDVSGEMGVDRHIYHNGDINTYIDFTDDRIQLYAGGRSMIDMQQNNNDMVFNEGSTQTDFRFEGGADENLLFLDGSTDNIGIGTSLPAYKLEISGALMLEDVAIPTASAGHSGIYSNAGELYALDASGNSTQISPHNENGLWWYNSTNTKTGKTLQIQMELLTKEVNRMLGGGYITENGEEIDQGINIIKDLALRTDTNIQTLEELQTSVDENLAIINQTLTTIDTEQKTKNNEQDESIINNTESLATLSENINSLTELTSNLTTTVEDHENRIATLEEMMGQDTSSNNQDTNNDQNSNNIELPEVLTAFADNLEMLKEEGKDIKFTLDGVLVVKELEAEKIVSEEIITKEISSEQITSEEMVSDKITMGSDSVGTAKIKKGKTSVKVSTDIVTENSHIILTPHGAITVGLADVEGGEGFTIEINETLDKDLKVEWFIVEEK